MPVMRCDTRQSHLWIQQQHHQQQNEELLETATTTAYVSTKPIFRQRHFELEPEPEVEEDDVDSTTEEPQPDPEEMMADLSATTNNNSKGNSNKNLLLQQQQQNERHLSPKARMSAICERLKGGDVASGDVMTMSEYAVAIEPAVKRPWTDDDEGEDDHMSSGSFSGREDDVENGAAPVNFNRYHDDDDDVNSLCEDDDRNADDNGVGLHPLEGAAGSSDSGDDETHLAARGMDVDDDEEEPEVDNQPPEDDDLDDEDERYRRDLLLAAGNRQRSTSRSSSPIEGNGQDSVGGFDDDEDNDVIDGTRGAAEYARFASGELKDDEDEVDDFEGRRDDGYFRSAALQSNVAAYRGQLLSTTTATDFRFDEPDVAAAPATEGSVEPSRSESRRNKRKNFKPRNIVYQFNVCDEPEFPDATGNDRHAPESAPPTDGYVWQSSFQREQQQQQVLSASPPAWSGQQVDCDQEPDVSHDVIAPRSRSPSVPPSASFVSRSRSPTPPTPTASRRGPSLPSLLASSLTAGETPPAAPDAQVAPRRGDSEQPLDLSDIATTTKRIFPGQHPSPRDGVGGKSASGRGHVEDRKVEQKRDQSGTIPVSAPPTSTPMDLTITRSPPEYVGMTSPVQGHAKGAGHHQQQQPSSKRSKEMHGGVDIMDLSRTYGHHHPLHLLHHNAAPGPMNTSALNDMEKFAGGVMTAARGVTGSPASMPFPISSSAGPGTTANRIATAQRRLSVSSATSTGRVGHPNSATLGGNPMAELTSSISASLLGLHHPHQQVAPPSSSTSGNAASVRAAAAAAAHAAAFEYMQQAVRDREDGLMIGGGPSGGPSGPGEATAMKDYAESTMKELLGLYGFGDMNPDAITKDVSMPNFAAGLGPSSSPLSTSLFKEHGKSSPVDYTRYVRRFSNATECGSNYCKDLNYREHFHCLDCNSRVFIKKEEMIRHFKWHKKRDESLQHGFLRYSPMDDCSEKFPNCSHNRKQTHYHCLKESCDKVYISTSDVQMHANYHRKDSAIIQEGFQRYRATEDCGTPGCIFAGQRTTHFHCRRQNCNYTFKNKADMEKHKSYHIKDEQLNRDGFKKFMKHEHCSFENCRFSRVCNHIHCIRPGCIYVLHSSGQLYSHKRKHERRENEMAYRKFKLAQSMMRTLGENQVLALKSMGEDYKSQEALANQMHGNLPMLHGSSGGLPVSMSGAPSDGLGGDNSTASYTEVLQRSLSKYTAFLTAGGQQLDPSMVHGLIPGAEHLSMMDMNPEMLKMRADDSWKKYLSRYTANDPCKPGCEFLYKDHYHCNAENCTMVFRSKDGVREHARNHEQQDQVTDAFYTTIDVGQSNCCPSDCPFQSKERHYHCGWQSCREIIVPADKPFRRLDHYKMHEYSHKLNLSKDPMTLTMSSVDGIFKRKRGRPPKNRVIEFPFTSGPSDFPQAIYTSFKLPKPNHHPQQPMMAMFDKNIFGGGASTGMHPSVSKSSPISPSDMMSSQLGLLTQNMMQAKVEMQDGFYVYGPGMPCPLLSSCPQIGRHHYHCAQRRCFYVTERSDILVMHSKDFHDNIDILEGFVFFDRGVDCRLHACHSNKVNRHFHCTRPGCSYSFVRYSTMAQHDAKHAGDANGVVTTTKKGASIHPTDANLGQYTNIFARSPQPHFPVSVKTERPPSSSPPVVAGPPPASSSTATPSEPRTPSPNSSSGSRTTVVKATGTFYPLSAFPHAYNHHHKETSRGLGAPVVPSRGACVAIPATTAPDGTRIKSEPIFDHGSKNHELEFDQPPNRMTAEWQALLEGHVAYSADRHCGRSFCKHGQQDHVHCTYCNKAFTKLSQLQPHLQKHMGVASPPGGLSSRLAATSEDDSLDRQEFEEARRRQAGVGGVDGAMREEDRRGGASSDDSSSGGSSTHFTTHNRSSPSTDSMQSQSAHPAYSGAGMLHRGHPGMAAALASSEMLLQQHHHQLQHPHHSFPGMNQPPALPYGVAPHGNHGPTAEELRFSPLHRNGSCGPAEVEQRSSPRGGGGSTSESGGAPSPGNSLESEPGSPSARHHSMQGSLKRSLSTGMDVSGGGGMRLDDSMASSSSVESKKAKLAAGCLRMLKEESVPEGYVRFRFNEDCRYPHCGYREHQTHFHCTRSDCGYSFCDKTRFVQHTARHDRLDTLMGGDFQQFRANVPCGHSDCVYLTAAAAAMAGGGGNGGGAGSSNNKASHFHCLKCEFVCTDTNKVVAHRRQHQKMDSITANGFEKFTATQTCSAEGCSHNQRQTHYHCMKCQYAVLGLSQMSAHKYRHAE